MSYRQPKQMKDGALELNQALLDQSLKRSSQRESTRQARTSQNLSALTNVASTLANQAIAPKADGLAKLNKDYANATTKLYKKVGSTDYDTGFEGTDKKADVFMNGIIDDYYGIKNNMKNMKDPSLGMQDLANIENMIDEYGKGVANMLAFNSAIKEASTADINSGKKLSNAGAPADQLQIIRKVTGGGSEAEDIEFKREGNNIILYDTKSDTYLNITEFNRSQDRGEDYLIYAKPTEELTTGFFGDIIKNENDEDVYNPTFITKGPNNTYSMTPQQQVDYKNSIMGDDPSKPKEKATGGSFRGLLQGDGNIAESIWEDQMFEDPNYQVKSQWPTGDLQVAIPYGDGFIETELSSDEIINNGTRASATKKDKDLYEAFYKEYYKPSLDFLAEQSVRAGAASMQITLDEPPEDNDDDASLLKDVNKQMSESGNELAPKEEELPESLKVDKGSNTNDKDGEEVKVVTEDFYTTNTDIEKPVYKNNKGEDVSFENDSAAFLTDIETTYGGYDGNEGTTGIPSYGEEDDTRIYDHLNSTKILPGKSGKYFDGTAKKGLKADIGEDVYNALSDSEKAILRMEHLNVGWNPKVLMLQTAGIISKDDRGKYHKPQNQKDPSKWDVNKLYEENKDKIADLLKGKDNVMLENLEAIYKGTDNSQNGDSEEKNKKRNKGYQAQYTKRIADIKDRYKIQDVVEEGEESAEDLVNNLTK